MDARLLTQLTSLLLLAGGCLLGVESRFAIPSHRLRQVSGAWLLLVLISFLGVLLGLQGQGATLSRQWHESPLPLTAAGLAVVWGGVTWTHVSTNRRQLVSLFVTCGLLCWLGGATAFRDQLLGLLGLGVMRITSETTGEFKSFANANWLALGCLLVGYSALLPGSLLNVSAETRTLTALVLIITGLGWITRWFPIPRLSADSTQRTLWGCVGDHVIPLLIVPVTLAQLLPRLIQSEFQLAVVLPATVLPLVLAAMRSARTKQISDVLSLAALIPVAAGVAAVRLAIWDVQHSQPDLTLAMATPLLTGAELLPVILISFSFAWLLTALGIGWLTGTASPHFAELANGNCQENFRSRLARGLALLGILSLAGCPPFSGYWWRLLLLSGLSIPHSRSPLTRLYEVVPANFIYCGLLAGGLFLMMLPLLNLGRRLVGPDKTSTSSNAP